MAFALSHCSRHAATSRSSKAAASEVASVVRCKPLALSRCWTRTTSFSRAEKRAESPLAQGWRRHTVHLQRLRAAEEDAADTSAAGQDSEEIKVEVEKESPTEEEQHMRPYYDSLVERARVALAEGKADASFLEGFLPDVESELRALQQRATQAEAQLAIMESQLEGAQAKYLRLNADFENFRKRSGTEKAALADGAKARVMEALLPVIDAFELAKDSLKLETEEEKKIDASYQGLYKQLVDAFRGLGLEVVPGVGAPFDPEMHEGIMREASSEVPDGTVLQEFRRGFKIGDRLLRASMVKVSFNDGSAAAPAEAPAQDAADGAVQEQEASA